MAASGKTVEQNTENDTKWQNGGGGEGGLVTHLPSSKSVYARKYRKGMIV